jgi:hypothetical protein
MGDTVSPLAQYATDALAFLPIGLVLWFAARLLPWGDSGPGPKAGREWTVGPHSRALAYRQQAREQR